MVSYSILVTLIILPAIHQERTREWISIQNYQVLAIVVSCLLGFILGKLYEKLKRISFSLTEQQEETQSAEGDETTKNKISRFLINGSYERNFKELRQKSDGFFKVQHLLEKKTYHIRKIRFSAILLKDLFAMVNNQSRIKTYVTSWIEGEDGSFVLYVQYE